jgi:hypothetical protein
MNKILFLGFFLLPLAGIAQKAQTGNRALFDLKSIAEVRIDFPGKNWSETLDSLRILGEELTQAQVTIDGATYTMAGVRYLGDKSYIVGQKRNPYLIRLDANISGQKHQGYNTLYLSSALRDPSMMREVLFHEIARQYMPSPLANYARLYVNGEYIGLFVNLELPAESFQKRHYKEFGNQVAHARIYAQPAAAPDCRKNIFGALEYEKNIQCYPANFRILTEDQDYEAIQELTRILNQEPQNIEKVLDVDQALWMLALNNVMVNLSSYTGISSNYFLYRDQNRRYHPIHWDLNLAFGSYKNIGSGSDIDNKNLHRLDPMLHADNPAKPLISKLLENPLYKKMYLAHIRQIVEEQFSRDQLSTRFKELENLILPAFSTDPNKAYTLEEFKSSRDNTIGKKTRIPGLVDLMGKRAAFLKTHPDLSALPSNITNLQFDTRAKLSTDQLDAFQLSAQADRFPLRMWLFYRFDTSMPFQAVSMEEEGSSGSGPGIKSFKKSIKAPSSDAVMQYYLMSENATMANFLPKDYTINPASVSLSELNR